MFPWRSVDARIHPDLVGTEKIKTPDRSRWSEALMCHWWRVKGSNLRSFRDGFTEETV